MAILIGLIFIIVIGGILVGYMHQREVTFAGTVTDKDVRQVTNPNYNNNMNSQPRGGITLNLGNTGNMSQTHNEYFIKVKTDAGKTINWTISEGKYQIVKIGDRVTKAKGTTDIEIANSAQPAPQPPTS